jgi:hypothetical protein
MIREFWRLKIILVIVTGGLFLSDSAMAIYSIRASSSIATSRQELTAQSALLRLLRADVKRANEIQRAIPKTKADCELFEDSLPSAGAGYSVISAELQDLSQKAGLQTGSISFHPKEFTAHGITEVSLDASVNGNYKSVVQFVNELQHSKNHYIVDDLTLVNDRGGSGVKVDLHMRSYLRAIA